MDEVKNPLAEGVAELGAQSVSELESTLTEERVREIVREELKAVPPPKPNKRRPFRLPSLGNKSDPQNKS